MLVLYCNVERKFVLMIVKKEKKEMPIVVDLDGPEGNAYSLLSMASRWCQDIGMDFEPIREELTSGDYVHLLRRMDYHFGGYVTFETENEELLDAIRGEN